MATGTTSSSLVKRGNLFLYTPLVSIVGGIQPRILQRVIGDRHRESGLLARLLLAYPPRKPKQWSESDISPAVEESISALLEKLYALQPGTDPDGNPEPVAIRLDPEAKGAFTTFYDQHAKESAELHGDLAAAYSKLEAAAARFALVIHLIRWAADDRTLRDPDTIDTDTMAAAIRLVEWFKAETQRVYSILAENEEAQEQRELAEWIDRRGGSVTVRDLQRGPREFRGDAEAAESALQELIEAGLGQWAHIPAGPVGGRPTRVFQLSGGGDGDTTPLNPGENIGSVTVATPENFENEWGEL